MTTNKSMLNRTIDGFRDYFNNDPSFDARYVGGQLFLYGNAKALDIGMGGGFGGTDAVKRDCVFDWYNNRHRSATRIMQGFKDTFAKFDPYGDSGMLQFPFYKRMISTTEYVNTMLLYKELDVMTNNWLAQLSDMLMQVESLIDQPWYKDQGISIDPTHCINLSKYTESIKIILDYLSKDYDGRNISPAASVTHAMTFDQLMNTMSAAKTVNESQLFTRDLRDFRNQPLTTIVDSDLTTLMALELYILQTINLYYTRANKLHLVYKNLFDTLRTGPVHETL